MDYGGSGYYNRAAMRKRRAYHRGAGCKNTWHSIPFIIAFLLEKTYNSSLFVDK